MAGKAHLDTTLALSRLSGDTVLYCKLLGDFRDRNAEFGPKMRAMLAAGDGVTARRHGHSLKSAAGTVGAMALQQAAARLEGLLGGTGRHDELADAVAEVELELRLVLNELAGADLTTPLAELSEHPVNVTEALALLHRLVAEDNSEALDMADRLARILASGPCRDSMGHIRALLLRYDFAGALAIIEDLLPASRQLG